MEDEGPTTMRRVLVVDNDAAVGRMLRIALRNSGFEPRVVARGAEAMAILDDDPPDAVLLDLSVSDRETGRLLARVRGTDGRGAPVPFLVISGMDPYEAARQFGDLGDRYLVKPFEPRELADKLDSLLCQAG